MVYGEGGQLLTGSLMDYALPDMDQSPVELATEIIEVPSPLGPMGARGVGEPPVIATAAAIANAIADATKVRLHQLPMTPPRVLAAIEAGASRAQPSSLASGVEDGGLGRRLVRPLTQHSQMARVARVVDRALGQRGADQVVDQVARRRSRSRRRGCGGRARS